MEGILASLIPTLLVAILTWHTNRVKKDRDQLDENRCARIRALEERSERLSERIQEHALEIQGVRAMSASASANVDELKDEIKDIRDNMVRRDDLSREMEGLRSHISDTLRLTPHTKRR